MCVSAWRRDLSPTDTSWTPQVRDTCLCYPAVSPRSHEQKVGVLRNTFVSTGLLCIRNNYSRHSNHSVDSLPLNHSFSLPAGFDPAVVCTDCMENGSSYSKDSDYLTHGYGHAGGLEYQQHSLPPPHPHCYPGEPYSIPLCNGTPNGIRKDNQGSTLPKNHNTLQMNQHDRKGKAIQHPVRLK